MAENKRAGLILEGKGTPPVSRVTDRNGPAAGAFREQYVREIRTGTGSLRSGARAVAASGLAQQQPGNRQKHRDEPQADQAVCHGQLRDLPDAQSLPAGIPQDDRKREAAEEKECDETDGMRGDDAESHEQLTQREPIPEADRSPGHNDGVQWKAAAREDLLEQDPKCRGKSSGEEEGVDGRLHGARFHAALSSGKRDP